MLCSFCLWLCEVSPQSLASAWVKQQLGHGPLRSLDCCYIVMTPCRKFHMAGAVELFKTGVEGATLGGFCPVMLETQGDSCEACRRVMQTGPDRGRMSFGRSPPYSKSKSPPAGGPAGQRPSVCPAFGGAGCGSKARQ